LNSFIKSPATGFGNYNLSLAIYVILPINIKTNEVNERNAGFAASNPRTSALYKDIPKIE